MTLFGRPIDVAVRTPERLKKILAENPYPDGNPSQVTVAFLTKAPAADAKQKVAAVAKDYEPFTFAGQEVYVNYSQGIGRSKLAEKFSTIIGVSSTVRNMRTIEKIVEMCGASSSTRAELALAPIGTLPEPGDLSPSHLDRPPRSSAPETPALRL